ncbi:hypothetical protein [Kribbella sp. CA-294648]|uniref:hypothetical protein n=1 Tax=Kribbella sp. CA-294648 TaxID=3239948 RepID=UPI003D8F9712
MTSISDKPVGSGDLAAFGKANNPAAAINYSVPVPGSYTIRRMQPVEFPADWFTQAAKIAGTSLEEQGVVTGPEDAPRLDPDRLRGWYERLTPLSIRPQQGPWGQLPARPPAPTTETPLAQVRSLPHGVQRSELLDKLAEVSVRQQENSRQPVALTVPMPGLGRSVRLVPILPTSYTGSSPTIALVEVFRVSSFLGDYGLGRTIQTYSLLPGERTTITVETWRSADESREDSTSVFDSSDRNAQSRFTDEVESQAGNSAENSGTWASSLSANVGGGFSFFGLFGASAGAQTYDAATSQYSRQQFSQSISRASSEHASQVNNSRQQSVHTATSTTTSTASSEGTAREIVNTNLRRVLNFVFRELNQTYETVTSLTEVRLAFYNGRQGSAQLVPLSELRSFLESTIVAQHRDEVARTLLTAIAECTDHRGSPQPMLQFGERLGGVFDWKNAALDEAGHLKDLNSPLDAKLAWRLIPDPVGQDDTPGPTVPGVVTARDKIVLRTDNVVIEALLGQADALDPYATAVQALDLQAREAAVENQKAQNLRLTKALELVAAQSNGEQVKAWDTVLGDKPDISVVPVASVSNGHPA